MALRGHVALLDVRQDVGQPTPGHRVFEGAAPGIRHIVVPVAAGREEADGIVIRLASQGELLEVVLTAHAVGRLPDLLDRRQQQADQYGNDSNDDEQLDEGEGAPPEATAWETYSIHGQDLQSA